MNKSPVIRSPETEKYLNISKQPPYILPSAATTNKHLFNRRGTLLDTSAESLRHSSLGLSLSFHKFDFRVQRETHDGCEVLYAISVVSSVIQCHSFGFYFLFPIFCFFFFFFLVCAKLRRAQPSQWYICYFLFSSSLLQHYSFSILFAALAFSLFGATLLFFSHFFWPSTTVSLFFFSNGNCRWQRCARVRFTNAIATTQWNSVGVLGLQLRSSTVPLKQPPYSLHHHTHVQYSHCVSRLRYSWQLVS